MKKIIFVIIIVIIIIIITIKINKNNSILNNKSIYYANPNTMVIKIDDLHKNEVKIYIPKTKYNLLNKEISNKTNVYIKDFKEILLDKNIQKDFTYTLYINYDEYSYKNIISYVFYVETYTGGAHPIHDIFTINYDTLNNCFIDIYSLKKENKNILNILSKISREKLIYNKNITDTKMMYDGTYPSYDNFTNFVFTKDGLLLFFKWYQVAPYSSGKFEILIPYNDIFSQLK